MGLDLDKISKAIDDDLADPNGYWNTLKKKQELESKRFDRFDKYLEENDFEILFERLKKEHDDDYIDACYKKGYMPYPNNKLSFLYSYIEDRLDPIDPPEWIDTSFATTVYFFKGRYFCITCGQGCVYYVYDSNKEKVLHV
jgi:hypothetical protein